MKLYARALKRATHSHIFAQVSQQKQEVGRVKGVHLMSVIGAGGRPALRYSSHIYTSPS